MWSRGFPWSSQARLVSGIKECGLRFCVHHVCMGTRTEAPTVRDFLFRKIVFPSNVLERSDGRGRIIGALDVVATISALALGRG